MSYKLKAVKPINDYLNKWLKKNKFEVTAELGNEFEYDTENEIIHYSVAVPSKHDECYFKLVHFYAPEIEQCDNFILSFFHELGHHETEIDFSDIEWDAYYEYLDRVEKQNKDKEVNDWELYKYYMHPLEIAATEWAVQYILGNPRKIKKFIKGLNPLIVNFIEENEIELDEEEQEKFDKYKEDLANGKCGRCQGKNN